MCLPGEQVLTRLSNRVQSQFIWMLQITAAQHCVCSRWAPLHGGTLQGVRPLPSGRTVGKATKSSFAPLAACQFCRTT